MPQVPRALFASSPGRTVQSAAPASFWQRRYYDRNVRDEREFTTKLGYLHRNPVKRGLAKEPGDWKWSSFGHYARREKGVVEIESEWTARDRETAAGGGPPRIFLSPRWARKIRSPHLGHRAMPCRIGVKQRFFTNNHPSNRCCRRLRRKPQIRASGRGIPWPALCRRPNARCIRALSQSR